MFDDEESLHDDGALDDLSYEDLDHAPATSHGTYLAGPQDGVEDLEGYQTGGYHPIHLGDLLGNDGRYQVIHKLGHGGFSTVWLCRDSLERKYVAIKVLTADVSAEGLPDLRLMQLDRSAPGAKYINIPKTHFSLDGPNGTHQCLALELLGPRVSPGIWIEMDDPGPILRKFCQQSALALEFLHRNSLCHGDFRPANILLKLANIDQLSEDEVLSLLGQPEQSEVVTESGEDLSPSVPKYLVPSTDLLSIGAEYLMEEVCVIDFGESYPILSQPADLGTPDNYLPPEVLIDGPGSIGVACDLWALGCTLFEIRRQVPLFYMISGENELLAEMVDFFGILPEKLWAKWEARSDFFDEKGKRITVGRVNEVNTLESNLRHEIEVLPRTKSEQKKVLAIPEEELKLCKDLLTRLFDYEPEKRLSAKEVVQHEWLKI